MEKKTYILVLYTFLLLVTMRSVLLSDFSTIILTLYGIILIPMGSIIKRDFSTITSPKDIFQKIWMYVFFGSIWTSALLFQDIYAVLMICTYTLALAFRINTRTLFIYGITLFGIFIAGFAVNQPSIYEICLIFSLYSFIASITYFTVQEIGIPNPLQSMGGRVLDIIMGAILISSLYVSFMQTYLPYILLALLTLRDNNKGPEKASLLALSSVKEYIIILALSLIVIIPLVNDYIVLENKNLLLVEIFSWFLFFYYLSTKVLDFLVSRNIIKER